MRRIIFFDCPLIPELIPCPSLALLLTTTPIEATHSTNSDGAFIIKTNKKGYGIGRLIWDKQKTTIALFHLAIDD